MSSLTSIPIPGISTALTEEGRPLPVIDVLHPAFRVADDPETIAALRRTSALMDARQRRMPRCLLRLFIRSAMRRSQLAKALLSGEHSVLPGMSTYVMKLGTGNLVPPFNSKVDRQFAAAPGVMSMRIRLQQTAKLLAAGVGPELIRRPGTPLHLVSIGGGTAIDCLNALILLRASGALLGGPVVIQLLDRDSNGPRFAARALASLRAPGAALAGVAAQVVHLEYDWNDTGPLQQLVGNSIGAGAILAASSEGALFEYGSDEAVIGNLKALSAHGRGAVVVAGSVTRADEATRAMLTLSPFRLIPRGAATFSELIRDSGFTLERVEESLLSDQVLLRASPLREPARE